jgi:hypothetical protein
LLAIFSPRSFSLPAPPSLREDRVPVRADQAEQQNESGHEQNAHDLPATLSIWLRRPGQRYSSPGRML